MSFTKMAVGSPQGVSEPRVSRRELPESRSLADVLRPANLRERLRNIRPVAPTFAQELEIARSQATRLGAQNRRMLDEVRRLQKQRGQMGAREAEHRA